MAKSSQPTGEGRTRRAIVKHLKTEGPLDSAQLAERLGLTAMAVRQHLYALQNEKLVTAEERAGPVGRPAKYWTLTRAADQLFPDAYAELTVSLIHDLGDAFGPAGMERLLESRYARQRTDYANRIGTPPTLQEALKRLARVRTEEGYMAEFHPDGKEGFLFLENHCPICAAATACEGFCAIELSLFQSVLGPGVSVERVEHIVAGARRCAYRITPVGGATSKIKRPRGAPSPRGSV